MAHFRRRMPYSLGADLLPEEPGPLKEQLDPEEEERLTSDMKELYKTLLPSVESEQRRVKFVQKLENLLNAQWPGNDIKVHVFGSSGNKLCSSDSDVDICITTPFKELERVCVLADFLAKSGMQRIVCVSHAKVPIVKIWDPELQVACDMNVNNTMALENTRMIRTYVEVDERVRPLAMIVKHWTKRRILNDAALGGTLSSYTWICLIINFLQTRSPPVVPSLQQRAINERKLQGTEPPSTSFDDDLDKLAGFGHQNTSTLGELLFQFFRYYGHELDYEKNVISVREGKLVSKEGKGWHLLQNNRLCVEEPFNTSRNLGNTADDTSFRGLHLELRRAFEATARGDLGKCCEQYEYPPEEERTWERPTPQPRAILTPMPVGPSRGGRGGGRGGRHASHYHRGASNTSRRASNTANRNNARPANPSFSTDVALQAQQAQSLLHDHLYQRIQILQAQEQELRLQLQNQAIMTGRTPPTLIRHPYLRFPLPPHENLSSEDDSRARAGSVNQPPLTAPIRQNVFFNSSCVPVAAQGIQGTNTNPPSPSLGSAVPDSRRSHRRSSVANSSPRGLRAQSQPARPLPSVMVPNFSMYCSTAQQDMNLRRSSEVSQRTTTEGEVYLSNGVSMPKSTYADETLHSEYVGYYVGDSTQPHGPYRGQLASSLAGLAIHSSELPSFPHNSPEYRPYMMASDQSNGSEHLDAPMAHSQPLQSQRLTRSRTLPDGGPLIIDGSVPRSEHRHSTNNHSSEQFTTDFSTSSSADRTYDTPRTTPDTLSQGILDQGSYDDLFGSSYETHHGSQSIGHINGWEPSFSHHDTETTGHIGRVETLSERLQRFQLSDSHFSLDPSAIADARQYRGTQYMCPTDDQFTHVQANGSPDNKSTQLLYSTQSPVKDSQMISPKTKHRVIDFELEKANGIPHKPRNKARSEVVNCSSSPDHKERHNDYGRKPNGVHAPHANSANGHHNSNSSGWQTTKRKYKKGQKAPTEQNEVTTRAEPLPADESLRKGG
ncbi:hypothetical protein PRK78_001863 [Emydomyces testavorans]|uniref:polynucleotide adenylyltransferase n=1 Tax=Emydomyces testavorans TaxID=2070801 RepID=A0AAF0DEN9_9EURO|nr:hypothetical protein PRK78_001863 [Emydomyces testavorans]